MTGPAGAPDERRQEAARIAFALLRFQEVLAYPPTFLAPSGAPELGTDAWQFTPSWQSVPRDAVEPFLAALPSPAILCPTLTRGVVALTLLHELSGDRRQWAEKTFSNATAIFDQLSAQLHLSAESRILLDFDSESHVLSHAGVRLWTQQFAVMAGWVLRALEDHPIAQARLLLCRSNGTWSSPLRFGLPERQEEPPS